jgi:hypothetical protein
MPDRWTRASSGLAFTALSLALLVGSLPAAASVIVPVSIERTVSASASVTNSATGLSDVHSDNPPVSTNPSLTFGVSAQTRAGLSGMSASADAGAGPVTIREGSTLGIEILTGAGASTAGTCFSCYAYANSRASLAFTFDLLAPIHVSAFLSFDNGLNAGGYVGLSRGSEAIRGAGNTGSPPFDLAPGRYTFTGNATAFASGRNANLSSRGVLLYEVIPEPGSGLLVSVGLLGLGSARRPRARRP